MTYDNVKALNNHIAIKTIGDEQFKIYGKVINDFDFAGSIEYMKMETSIPTQGNVYMLFDENLEKSLPKAKIEQKFYGEMNCQVGFCNGSNSSLNGLEYHKGSELLVAVTDLVLLLGNAWDIENNNGEGTFEYDSSMVEAFFVPSGIAIELYATTLHFAPCKVHRSGFKSIIILPKGTNGPLENKSEGILFAINKWLIIHNEAEKLREKGAVVGIKGSNLSISYIE